MKRILNFSGLLIGLKEAALSPRGSTRFQPRFDWIFGNSLSCRKRHGCGVRPFMDLDRLFNNRLITSLLDCPTREVSDESLARGNESSHDVNYDSQGVLVVH